MTSDLSCDVTLAESSMSQPLFLLCNFSPDLDTEGSSINVNSSVKEFCFSLLFLHPSPQLAASHCVPAWPPALLPCVPFPDGGSDGPENGMLLLPPWPVSSSLPPLPCSAGDKGEAMCRHRADQGEKEHEE